MLLFYIRHGAPTYSPDALTPLGKRQAEAVAKRLALYGIDKIYSSTSNRAYETALPLSEILQKDITQMDFANENHLWQELTVGDPDHRTWAMADPRYREYFCREDVIDLKRKWYTHPLFEGTRFGEGIERVQRESDAFLASLGYEHDLKNNRYNSIAPNDKRIALFAHQGFGIAFLSCLLDVPYPLMSTRFDLSHSSMTVIEFKGDAMVIPTVLQLSSDSHLYKEGIMTGYNNGIRF